ncbi:unnamed protein product, partial [Allacma fusca]
TDGYQDDVEPCNAQQQQPVGNLPASRNCHGKIQ